MPSTGILKSPAGWPLTGRCVTTLRTRFGPILEEPVPGSPDRRRTRQALRDRNPTSCLCVATACPSAPPVGSPWRPVSCSARSHLNSEPVSWEPPPSPNTTANCWRRECSSEALTQPTGRAPGNGHPRCRSVSAFFQKAVSIAVHSNLGDAGRWVGLQRCGELEVLGSGPFGSAIANPTRNTVPAGSNLPSARHPGRNGHNCR